MNRRGPKRKPYNGGMDVLREMFDIIEASGLTDDEVEVRAGFSHGTLHRARRLHSTPGLDFVVAVLEVLDAKLKIER